MAVLVVVGSVHRGVSGLWGPVDVRGGMPVLLLLQQHQDLVRGSGTGHQRVPGPAERGGDGEHHRHVSVSSLLRRPVEEPEMPNSRVVLLRVRFAFLISACVYFQSTFQM